MTSTAFQVASRGEETAAIEALLFARMLEPLTRALGPLADAATFPLALSLAKRRE